MGRSQKFETSMPVQLKASPFSLWSRVNFYAKFGTIQTDSFSESLARKTDTPFRIIWSVLVDTWGELKGYRLTSLHTCNRWSERCRVVPLKVVLHLGHATNLPSPCLATLNLKGYDFFCRVYGFWVIWWTAGSAKLCDKNMCGLVITFVTSIIKIWPIFASFI